MKHLPKIILLVSATMFALSLTQAGSDIHYGALKPVSAILFIVFFILHVLQKEVAKFDEEYDKNIAVARPKSASRGSNNHDVGVKTPASAFAR